MSKHLKPHSDLIPGQAPALHSHSDMQQPADLSENTQAPTLPHETPRPPQSHTAPTLTADQLTLDAVFAMVKHSFSNLLSRLDYEKTDIDAAVGSETYLSAVADKLNKLRKEEGMGLEELFPERSEGPQGRSEGIRAGEGQSAGGAGSAGSGGGRSDEAATASKKTAQDPDKNLMPPPPKPQRQPQSFPSTSTSAEDAEVRMKAKGMIGQMALAIVDGLHEDMGCEADATFAELGHQMRQAGYWQSVEGCEGDHGFFKITSPEYQGPEEDAPKVARLEEFVTLVKALMDLLPGAIKKREEVLSR